jgi:hypothetical protein
MKMTNELTKTLQYVFDNINKQSTEELVKHIKPYAAEIQQIVKMEEACFEEIA